MSDDDEMRPEYDLSGVGRPNRFARAAVIAALNDRFREGLPATGPGRTLMTQGVAALPTSDLTLVLLRVVTFEQFTPENDPWGEHDFGAFALDHWRFFWKIDYFGDASLTTAGDPAAPDCYRVLTVMLAEEY